MEKQAETKEETPDAANAAEAKPVAAAEQHPKRLYVGNLSYTAREMDLIRIFGEFGKLATVDIVFHRRGPEAGKPRGFAFVEFEEGSDAQRAMRVLHDKRVLGRNIVVRACQPDELKDGGGAFGESSAGGSGGVGGSRVQKRAQLQAIDAKIASLRAKLQKKSH